MRIYLKLFITIQPLRVMTRPYFPSLRISGVNGKLVCHILFRLGRNDEIRKEYFSTGN